MKIHPGKRTRRFPCCNCERSEGLSVA